MADQIFLPMVLCYFNIIKILYFFWFGLITEYQSKIWKTLLVLELT